MATSRRTPITVLLVLGALTTLIVYGWVVPNEIRTGQGETALVYVVAGWVPYTVTFYALGHVAPPPDGLPSMRAVDAGAILVVLALLVSVSITRVGIHPERIPEAHAIQAIAVFVGLALFGWGLGRRSVAIESVLGRDTG